MNFTQVQTYFKDRDKKFTNLQLEILSFIHAREVNIEDINKEIFSRYANKSTMDVMFTPTNYYGLICKEYCKDSFVEYQKKLKVENWRKKINEDI